MSPHKVGPDYIDPSYHAAACGVPGRNLDPWLTGEDLVAPLLPHGAPRRADVAVIEGVMGLFDGAAGRGDFASTAHVARLTGAPVILVVGAAGTSRSIAATVHGFAGWDRSSGSPGSCSTRCRPTGTRPCCATRSRRRASRSSARCGATRRCTRRRATSGWSRPASGPASVGAWLPGLRELVRRDLDLDLLMGIARGAPDLAAEPWSPEPAGALDGRGPARRGQPPTPRAPAPPGWRWPAGAAFTFSYAEHAELLAAAGAEVVTFDPLSEEKLPDGTDALVVGGGFPEVHATGLAANTTLRERGQGPRRERHAGRGRVRGPAVARRVAGRRAQCGVIPARARMTGSCRSATARRPRCATPRCCRPARRSGRTSSTARSASPAHGDDPAWRLADGGRSGWAGPGLLASYLHLHWAGLPGAADRLIRAALARRSLS